MNVCTAVFFSSCFDSLISIFWKYPERFNAVMKFATELIEADGSVHGDGRTLLRHRRQPQIFGPRYRIGDSVQQFLAAGAIALQLLDRGYALLQYLFLFLEQLPPAV